MCFRGVMKDGCVHLIVGDIMHMKGEKGVCHGKLHARKVCTWMRKECVASRMRWKRVCALDVRCEKGMLFGEM